MADDNIFNTSNKNEQSPMAENQKENTIPIEQETAAETVANSAENMGEQSTDRALGDESVSFDGARKEPEQTANLADEEFSGQKNGYQGQNASYGSQGTYYSYTPNSNNNYNYNNGQYNNSPTYYQQGYYGNRGFQQPPKKKRKGLKIAFSAVGIVAIVTVICLFGYWTISEISKIFGNQNSGVVSSDRSETEDNSSYEKLVINSKPEGSDEYTANSDGSMTAAAVIEKVRPSIVGIVQYVNANNGIPTINSQGSGIIISEDGYIITNAHVVSGASMITVVLDNDEEYRATLKGLDEQSDLAVIKIEETGLTAAELGDSSETVVGESVIAIGNPGGLDLAGSCTGGMVSGLNRTISSDTTGYAMSYIQTDAAINPGNSGGALVNMYGQVIGINSAKISADGYEGLGFAIPINEAIPIVGDLQQYGYVKNRAKIGISFQLITEIVSQYYNNTIPAGLLITEIDEECDIATKDIEINDIITKIDGRAISSTSAVYSVLQTKKPGDTVRLTVYRIGTRMSSSKTFEVDIILSEDKGNK